jgi:hypothetical protein
VFAIAWHAAIGLFPALVKNAQAGWQKQLQQQAQHEYTLLQQHGQRDRQLEEQTYINELRKDFFLFETNLQRESEKIRFGGQLQLQVSADLARRFADASPFIDGLEDLRRQSVLG